MLVTDAAASVAIDALPRAIDSGLSQWAEGLGIGGADVEDWSLRVYLIEDEAKFRALGLWPDQSSEFRHGLSLGYEVWLRQQTTDYYRRHLLLHEATHSFMATVLGSCGPGWYMEGMAELYGTHAWDGDTLRLATMPRSRDAAKDWGRIRLIQDAVAEGRRLPIEAVRKIDNRVVIPTESYAWVWALCHFLNTHPTYRDGFQKLPDWVTSDKFDRHFTEIYAGRRQQLDQEWRLFVSTLTYGHDLQREAIDFQVGKPLATDRSHQIELRVDRGWQSSGIRVKAGETYRIRGSGQFTIGQEPDGTPWPCEANGITLVHHAGRPIGQLLATLDAGSGAFIESTPIGTESDYTPPASGTMYLRVNDSPASLAENAGTLEVVVKDLASRRR